MEKTRFRSLAVAGVLSLCTIGMLPHSRHTAGRKQTWLCWGWGGPRRSGRQRL